jgi:hypothetical protein
MLGRIGYLLKRYSWQTPSYAASGDRKHKAQVAPNLSGKKFEAAGSYDT